MLSLEQTFDLITKAQDGDKDAISILLKENIPLVKSVIKRFSNQYIEYDDLFQLGCMGFLKAIKNFDKSFNVKFSTYVVPMIIGEVKRFLRDDGIIKVSRSIKTQNLHINRYIKLYQQTHNKKPSIQEISNYFGIEEQELIFIMDSNKHPISIYTPISEEEGGLFLIDRYEQDDESEVNFEKLNLQIVLNSLTEREKKLVLLRFFRDKTQTEIAHVLNLSQVQVSRLENKILSQLREKLIVNES